MNALQAIVGDMVGLIVVSASQSRRNSHKFRFAPEA